MNTDEIINKLGLRIATLEVRNIALEVELAEAQAQLPVFVEPEDYEDQMEDTENE